MYQRLDILHGDFVVLREDLKSSNFELLTSVAIPKGGHTRIFLPFWALTCQEYSLKIKLQITSSKIDLCQPRPN
ncbi:hypothetical protein JTE90_006381 [Oedothorax gibbosus]|uniref:Uncharacterized protein n=1 Tax=Oedothorax gibbosus TaxID=931172 RepID=A0AAV6VW43_9ARAC|nr:hypothetical protein JTE90_006381 [Oedothorax gibbosus]